MLVCIYYCMVFFYHLIILFQIIHHPAVTLSTAIPIILAMVISVQGAYQDIISILQANAENVILAVNVVMVASVTTAIHQHVLRVLTFATMQIAKQRDVLKMLLLNVPPVLTVSIWKITFVFVVTMLTVSVTLLIVVTNVYQGIIIQIHFTQIVFLVNMDIYVNLIVYVLVKMEHVIKNLARV